MSAEAAGKTDGAAYASRCLSQSSIHLNLLGGDIAIGTRGRRYWNVWSQQERSMYLQAYVIGVKDTVKRHVQNIARQAAINNTTAIAMAQRSDLIALGQAMGSVRIPLAIREAGCASVYRAEYGNTLRSYVQ